MQDTSSKQTKQKYKPDHQQTGLRSHLALPIRGKTNKQTKTGQTSPSMKLTQTTRPNLDGQKLKGRKNSTLGISSLGKGDLKLKEK